ncbi:hypothetical protein GTZ99_03170 [Novosphingobium sp. FSY-8]|uniref:Uncharacterized protein n=1 Tax=Novosphingobium ovatum TaxID=1908523 RepID=A0ABW9XAK0_9SPHN|nr:hypothetical protein [Novosphingobium ovatum]NBC35553.1 hypothetical protein [Novosphingobium ovatum]
MTDTPTPLCVNCRHHWLRVSSGQAICTRPYRTAVCRVFGSRNIPLNALAEHERSAFTGLTSTRLKCGPQGRFFDPAPPATPPHQGSGGQRP